MHPLNTLLAELGLPQIVVAASVASDGRATIVFNPRSSLEDRQRVLAGLDAPFVQYTLPPNARGPKLSQFGQSLPLAPEAKPKQADTLLDARRDLMRRTIIGLIFDALKLTGSVPLSTGAIIQQIEQRPDLTPQQKRAMLSFGNVTEGDDFHLMDRKALTQGFADVLDALTQRLMVEKDADPKTGAALWRFPIFLRTPRMPRPVAVNMALGSFEGGLSYRPEDWDERKRYFFATPRPVVINPEEVGLMLWRNENRAAQEAMGYGDRAGYVGAVRIAKINPCPSQIWKTLREGMAPAQALEKVTARGYDFVEELDRVYIGHPSQVQILSIEPIPLPIQVKYRSVF